MGKSKKKYDRAKKGLSRAVVTASLAIHKGRSEADADELFKSEVKTVISRQTLRYVLEAVPAVISQCQERKFLDIVDKGKRGQVALYIKPLIAMETKWLYKEVK